MSTGSDKQIVAWDTETRLIGPAQQAPPLVCTSIKFRDKGGELLLHHTESREFFDQILHDQQCRFVGHSLAFDLGIVCEKWPEFLPATFDAIEEGRASCTMLRMKLLDIAAGCYRGEFVQRKNEEGKTTTEWFSISYDLSSTFWRFTKKRLIKDTWRLRYREFEDIPVEEWPAGAQEYPIQDAVATWAVWHGQENVNTYLKDELTRKFPEIKKPNPLGDETRQMMAAWWIYLMRTWGIRTDPNRLKQLEKETQRAYTKAKKFLQKVTVCSKCGRALVSRSIGSPPECLKHPGAPYSTLVKHDGVRDTKAAKLRMAHVMGGEKYCRRTATGEISLDMEACEVAADPLLDEYKALSSLQTVVNKDIPALKKGVQLPVHSNFNSLIATGRTSSSAPNIQNIRRLPGIRECFVPRKGNVFVIADYDGLELRTLAQVCKSLFGESKLANILNQNKDPHLIVAATILGMLYEEAARLNDAQDAEVDSARQTGKIANFGFPGGLGYEALILFAKKVYKIMLTEMDARRLKEDWFKSFPEMRKYFDYIGAKTAASFDGTATIQQLFTDRIRGKIRFTVACNSMFQGLGSDATKAAGWLIAKACYVEQGSPLYGCRIVNYVHDEFILECPEDRGHEGAMELKRLMELGAAPYLPDVPPVVSKPMVARCWSKKAKPVWKLGGDKPVNENDRLVPWEYVA